MKNFKEINDDDLEKIRTQIENTLRHNHRLFLGFFPDVLFVKNEKEDDLIFHVSTQKLFDRNDTSNLPPDLVACILPDMTIQVSGMGTEGTDGPEISELIQATIREYLKGAGF